MDQRASRAPHPHFPVAVLKCCPAEQCGCLAPSGHQSLPPGFLCQTNIIIDFQLPLVPPPNEGRAACRVCSQIDPSPSFPQKFPASISWKDMARFSRGHSRAASYQPSERQHFIVSLCIDSENIGNFLPAWIVLNYKPIYRWSQGCQVDGNVLR